MFNGRIVGGNDTTIEEIPWQVSMITFGSHRCGGSIMTTTKIITATHCVRGAMIQYTAVRAGSTYLNSGGVIIPVNRIIEHESFGVPTYFDNNIALMYLEQPLIFGPGIQAVNLPPHGLIVEPGTYAIVSGWGSLDYTSGPVEILQSVAIPVVDNDICREAYRERHLVTDGMMCAGYMEEGGRDVCEHDAGGPLVIDGVLHGIISWGYRCALPGYPGVNTRVAHYRNWIDRWD